MAKNDETAVTAKAIGLILALPLGALLALAVAWWQTTVGLTLWGWFAPWPLPVTQAQAIGLLLLVRVMTVKIPPRDDERTPMQLAKAVWQYGVMLPFVVLLAGAFLSWWT